MSTTRLLNKIDRRLTQLTLAPIEVFVFHCVSDTFDPSLCQRQDWTPTDYFKHQIQQLKSQYTFIPLPEVYHRLTHDRFRRTKYAALTCDDGNASILSILPFLSSEQVPLTLFINPKYLDGISIRENYCSHPRYITLDQLSAIQSPMVNIAMHGFKHDDCTLMSRTDFDDSVSKCEELLKQHPRYINYYAYTWGKYNDTTQSVLRERNIIPLFCDGASNRRYRDGISRRCIDTPGTAKL